MTRPLSTLAVAAAGLIASLASLAAPASAADPDPAQAIFDRGVAHLDAGRFDKACPDIEQSYQLDPRPGTLFTLAECEAKRGRLATAVARYDEYIALYATLPPDKKQKQTDREKVSKEARAALLAQVPEITVKLSPSAPAGTVVTRDGAPLKAAALGGPLRVDPGEHVLGAHPPHGPLTERRVTVRKGEKRAVLLDVKEDLAAAAAAALPAEPPPATAPGPSGRRIGAFVSVGIGVAGVVMGAVTGGLALGKKSTVDQGCGARAGFADPTACNATGIAAASSLSTLGLVSTVGFVVGAAGLATGAVLLATEPKAHDASTRRRWVSAGVVAAGSTGRALRRERRLVTVNPTGRRLPQ